MFRMLTVTAAVIVVVGGIVLADLAGEFADDIKGTVKSVDVDKNTLTVTVDDKDQTFTIPADAKIVSKKKNSTDLADVKGGLKGVKEGRTVTVTTEEKTEKKTVDGKETDVKTVTVKQVLVGGKKKSN